MSGVRKGHCTSPCVRWREDRDQCDTRPVVGCRRKQRKRARTHTHTHTGGLGCIVAEADGGETDDGVEQEVDGEVLCTAVIGIPAVVVLNE